MIHINHPHTILTKSSTTRPITLGKGRHGHPLQKCFLIAKPKPTRLSTGFIDSVREFLNGSKERVNWMSGVLKADSVWYVTPWRSRTCFVSSINGCRAENYRDHPSFRGLILLTTTIPKIYVSGYVTLCLGNVFHYWRFLHISIIDIYPPSSFKPFCFQLPPPPSKDV